MTDTQYALLYSVSPANAHTAMFNEYFNYVYSIVFNKLRSCGTKEDIEECVSDVFAAVFEKYEKNGFSSGSLNGLIGTIAANKAISYFRSLSSKSKYTAEIDETALSEISDDELLVENAEKKELKDILLSCVNALGEPDSTMIIQKYYYNMNSSQIAEQHSLTSAGVRMRCARALKKLEKMLSEKGFGLKECSL